MTRNLVSKLGLGRAFRAAMLGGLVLAVVPTAVGCLDRPVAPASPRTSNTLTDQVRVSAVDKIDILFMIDNSASMADKQKILKDAVPDLINRLLSPQCVTTDATGKVTPLPKDQQPVNYGDKCPAGSGAEFTAITDIHIGVVTSSLGGHGADFCTDVDPGAPQTQQSNVTLDDHGHLLNRGTRTDLTAFTFPKAATYQDEGFLAWDPAGTKNTPPGEADEVNLKKNFQDVVVGADQIGCGYESQLEGWYRFLIDPTPPLTVTPPAGFDQATTIQGLYGVGPAVVDGIDTVLLQQRAEFLRPDSLVSVIMLTDENDCSLIDGALTGDVCDKPVLDAAGNPTGDCQEDRKGWPAGYGVEGNMQGYTTDADGRVKGNPFQVNFAVLERRRAGGDFRMYPGTSACDSDPTSPDCQSCLANPAADPRCMAPLASNVDSNALRCWDPKRRFGVDPFYPLGRYVNGLTQTTVYDRGGNLVTNPLFDDLPYKAAKAAGTSINRAKITPRDAKLVFFAGIVGVPWQNIARNPQDLSEGYLPGVVSDTEPKAINWQQIYGDPNSSDPTTKRDPLMVETNAARSGTNVLGEALSADPTMWNTINGHEWVAGDGDLQYACVFSLPTPTMNGVDCTDPATKNPLCEAPSAADPKKGDGKATSTQYRAKAYPGLRYMPVLEQVKGNGILASICTPNTTDPNRDDYGYRPAVNAIIDRLKTQLTGRCLPRQLAPNPDGSTPCLIIDARFLNDKASPPDPAQVTECKKCNGIARKQIDPAIVKSLTGDVLNYECLCEVTQVTGADLKECTTVNKLESFSSSTNAGGWCYVDPSAISSSAPNAATLKQEAEAIVEKCGANEKRTIRFVNAGTENTTLFITCLGAASGTSTESDTPGLPATTGAAGSAGAGGGG